MKQRFEFVDYRNIHPGEWYWSHAMKEPFQHPDDASPTQFEGKYIILKPIEDHIEKAPDTKTKELIPEQPYAYKAEFHGYWTVIIGYSLWDLLNKLEKQNWKPKQVKSITALMPNGEDYEINRVEYVTLVEGFKYE